MQRFDTTITYVSGDATLPTCEGVKVIAHICNDVGKWGKGFVLALGARWPQAEHAYRAWHLTKGTNSVPPFKRGELQLLKVSEDTFIANMIAQEGIASYLNEKPIRYDALEQCLTKLAEFAVTTRSSVHMPRIGCGLAGGEWWEVEQIIMKTLVAKGVVTYVYDYLPN